MKSTVYFTKIATEKAGKYLNSLERKLQGEHLLACLPDTDKEIFSVSILKTVLLFLTSQVV